MALAYKILLTEEVINIEFIQALHQIQHSDVARILIDIFESLMLNISLRYSYLAWNKDISFIFQ